MRNENQERRSDLASEAEPDHTIFSRDQFLRYGAFSAVWYGTAMLMSSPHITPQLATAAVPVTLIEAALLYFPTTFVVTRGARLASRTLSATQALTQQVGQSLSNVLGRRNRDQFENEQGPLDIEEHAIPDPAGIPSRVEAIAPAISTPVTQISTTMSAPKTAAPRSLSLSDNAQPSSQRGKQVTQQPPAKRAKKTTEPTSSSHKGPQRRSTRKRR